MISIGVLSNARSAVLELLHSYLPAAGRFDVSLTALTPKSDYHVHDIFVLEKTIHGLDKSLIDSCGKTVILDNDNSEIVKSLAHLEVCAISCGLSQKSTVTASSVGENGFTYCLQRSIFDVNGNEILPQEFGINFKRKPTSLQAYLLGVTALIICGEIGENLQDFMF